MLPMTFLFLGGRLAVDVLDTVIACDLLGRRQDVASWGAAAGVVADRDLRNVAREPAGLRAFREALRRGLVAWAAAGTPPARLIALLNHHLARDPAVTEVSRKGRDVVTRLRSAGGPIERLYGAVAIGGGADHAGRSPPAAQMRQPDLPPDVLRHVEIRPAPLVLDAAVRRPRQGPRVLPAPPGGHERGGDSAPGSHTVNVLPAPGVLVTVMWPPCSSASSRAMARPRPLPPRSRLRD